MGAPSPEPLSLKISEQIIGYLNFSSGAEDGGFTSNVDKLFDEVGSSREGRQTTARQVYNLLHAELTGISSSGRTGLGCTAQANAVLKLAYEHLLPAYLSHHRDLLFHQDEQFLYNSFFVARAFRTILQAGGPWNETDRIVASAIAQLNDYLGHRPVAVLESQKIEPYEHEWIAPVPVYLKDVGIATGQYRELIEIAIATLSRTDGVILREAFFSLDRMQELAIDPRAFDFDHPINKRPNHHFGQWDPHSIDDKKYYSRFIFHQVTLDALLDRIDRRLAADPEQSRRELMIEAGSVLACTILMASGISGHGPGTFDSNTTLADLLPTIAGYRDQFYSELIQRLPGEHRDRLNREAESRRQPFGSARQDLNAELAKRRAAQLVNCRLATIFARMGFCEAAVKQSQVVPVASSRILCQIDCLLSGAKQATMKRKLAVAFPIIPRVMQLLKDGVECGGIVDPWNILGFDANYSLFPASENSVPDHRVYELVDLVERILGMCSSIWSEAAAVDDLETCGAIKEEFAEIVAWWRKYAAHEVMAVDAVDPQEIFDAAELVAQALNLWHKGGAAAGDLEFWKPHADLFDSPKAYHLVIESLMDRGDYQTSSALLVHWLSNAEYIRLQHGDSSFHNLMWRWISEQKELLKKSDFETRHEIWNRIRKFYDYVEANAESYGQAPRFELDRNIAELMAADELDEEDELLDEDSGDDLFEAAYEGVTYLDTTDDGMEGSIFDSDLNLDDELEAEVDRLFDRLEFIATMANFWRMAATFPLPIDQGVELNDSAVRQLKNRRDILAGWIQHANDHRSGLTTLLNSVFEYKIPVSGVDHESLMQYDRHRLYKESLLDRIVETCVESEQAVCMLAAAIAAIDHLIDDQPITKLMNGVNGKAPLISLFAAVLLSDLKLIKKQFPHAIEYLHAQPLLYVPLTRGGKPGDIVQARLLQEEIRDLAGSLPVLGLFVETHELISTALAMERNHRFANGAVTEFDDLFKVAYRSMVKCLVQSTQLLEQHLSSSEQDNSQAASETEGVLFDCIEMVTESMSTLWLEHSRTLRLSVVEKLNDPRLWNELVDFVKRYGNGLFTQRFLHLSNARAILHQDVATWLENVQNSAVPFDLRILDEMDKAISKQKAVRFLTLILEAVCENYNEYRDYNTTTTQSDHGEQLYTLLDFLRLRSRYDRVCWYLKPIVWGHEILVRDGQNSVARMWRRSLTDQIGPEADRYLQQLEELRSTYSIQMASVGRRLEGKFVHPMQIDRLRSLVRPAMANPDSKKSQRMFDLLQQETQAFTRATAGVGVDLPAWLAALESEVQQHYLPLRLRSKNKEQTLILPVDVPISRLREQLELLPRKES